MENFASEPAIVVAAICASLSRVTVLPGYALPLNTALVDGAETIPPPPPPPPPPPEPPEEPEVHEDVLNSQADEQERVPPVKPCVVQEAPFKLEPSHCSGLSTILSPQTVIFTVALMVVLTA